MNVLDQVTVQLVRIACYQCAVVFGIPDSLQQACLDDHGRSFYCPNGHGQHYLGRTPKEKAEAEAFAARRQAEYWEQRAREHAQETARALASQRVTKGHLTRLKRRVGAGVCPCCQRTFQQLARHVAAKHPGYGGDP